MKHKLHRTLTNPLTVILPIVVVLLLGWNHYVSSARDLSISTQNLLPNGSFDNFNTNNAPTAWTLNKSGSFNYTTTQNKGYVAGKLLSLHVNNYHSGSLALTSSKVTLQPHKTYLYKGYYHTNVSFDLLIRYFYTNGSSQLRYTQTYPGNNSSWSTDSFAFQSQGNVRAVQFVYRLAGNGALQLDDTYLEAKSSGVYVAPTLRDTNILIPNGDVTQGASVIPIDWLTYNTGKNHAVFSYVHKPQQTPYLSVSVDSYKSGEAKWQYRPRAVSANQAFTFGINYRSTAPALIVAEYTLQDGKHQFSTLATLMPAGEWTRRQAVFEVPPGATTLFVSAILQHNGTLDTTGYALRDSTRLGPRTFSRPLVSITFDDGWESAIENAVPIMNTFGYKGTFYLNASTLDANDFISSKQMEALAAAGSEIGSHGFAHVDMTTINESELQSELQIGQSVLKQRTNNKISDFATPYGKGDAEVQYYARKYYQSLRTTDSGINTRQNLDPYDLKVFYVGNNTRASEIQDALNEAKAYHGWLILVYHRVQSSNTKVTAAGEDTIISPQSFKQQLNLIQQSALPVKTVSAALDELQRQ